jgi:hypothetical protein
MIDVKLKRVSYGIAAALVICKEWKSWQSAEGGSAPDRARSAEAPCRREAGLVVLAGVRFPECHFYHDSNQRDKSTAKLAQHRLGYFAHDAGRRRATVQLHRLRCRDQATGRSPSRLVDPRKAIGWFRRGLVRSPNPIRARANRGPQFTIQDSIAACSATWANAPSKTPSSFPSIDRIILSASIGKIGSLYDRRSMSAA